MSVQPRVSVLMAVWNAEPYLRQAVDSVLSQSLGEVELLAVDDASTDNSLSILREYANSYPDKVRVFALRDNSGQAVARNLALRHARGELVCMLDADDWLSPDALGLAVEQFTSPDICCTVLRLIKEETDGTSVPYPWPLPTLEPITGEEAFRLSLDWTLHGLYVVRRKLHQRYPYDTSCRLYSDDNTTRLHYLHSPLVAFCQGEYHYRQHAQSSTRALTANRFLHVDANLNMKRTLEQESVSSHILRQYERIRWQNYKGQLRLYHLRGGELSPDERQQVHSRLRSVYQTFSQHRLLPFPLFELRQWLGAKLRKN
ncbi:MAG: glycosyltransferase [Prevotellaceae bacterium]|nr:glycosyltransferase [Prevotellaceae bacterium]